ncbi:MAG TPA: restriction endonuclease subunit S [Candidatus Wunengus sp. YC60]|uniref:restriction endonuclease subunit S n=1 Tax=Candidatus Wunengus sp. YC60 TaxID=3367697 RepID=UPI004027B192
MSNIPQGFQKTEVGIIPRDWGVTRLGELSYMKSGETITAKRISEIDTFPCYGGNGLRGYTSGYTHNGNFALIGRQGALCGNVQFVNGKFYASEHAVVVTPKVGTDIKWLYYMLVDMNLNQYSESSAQPGLSVAKILRLPITLPPTKAEQTAIATALNDADKLITELEKLIAKKRNIKQGAMQELLRPKEGWEVRPVEELFDVTAGGDFKKDLSSIIKDEKYCYPVYSNSLVDKGLYGFCSYATSEANCITVTARGTIGFANYRNHKFTAIGRVLVLRPKMEVDCFYISEYINNRIEFVLEVTGVPQLTAPQISKYLIALPKTKEEQLNISETLQDMDAEIEALEKKLEKYKMLKQGMMQNLLTGEIRLV